MATDPPPYFPYPQVMLTSGSGGNADENAPVIWPHPNEPQVLSGYSPITGWVKVGEAPLTSEGLTISPSGTRCVRVEHPNRQNRKTGWQVLATLGGFYAQDPRVCLRTGKSNRRLLDV